jgi:hypothetical protein
MYLEGKPECVWTDELHQVHRVARTQRPGEDNWLKTSNHTAGESKSLEKGTYTLVASLTSGGSMTRYLKPELFEFFDGLMEVMNQKQDQYGSAEGRQTVDRMMELDPICPLAMIQKYIDRIAHRPDKTERDLLKIVTYAFFMWRAHRAGLASQTPRR